MIPYHNKNFLKTATNNNSNSCKDFWDYSRNIFQKAWKARDIDADDAWNIISGNGLKTWNGSWASNTHRRNPQG